MQTETDVRVGIIDTRAVFNIWHPRVNVPRPTCNFQIYFVRRYAVRNSIGRRKDTQLAHIIIWYKDVTNVIGSPYPTHPTNIVICIMCQHFRKVSSQNFNLDWNS